MQLKRLEISGFKSFADRCAIDFPPGISAIVGPNGCGKSNIIDAIKWVMGEQSVRQLRGKSMGDVIFAGTDKRPSLNMSEVSLIITGHDGAEGGKAGGYTEIMITRRLYRSGESQYLINRQPCRLKDVSDIFLRYSLGSRSCAIIQQGNIGAITDASPEERRTFIEEAAGVVRYKSRKQEAVTKVNATRDNIARLNDILEEIDNRLSELFVEAQRARYYQDCRERLKKIDILITVFYHEQYSRKIESTEKLLKQLNETTGDKTEEIENLHKALEEIESSRREKEEKISQKKAEKSEKQKNAEKFEYEIRHLENEKTRIAGENIRLSKSFEELKEKNTNLEKELSEETEKQKKLEERIDYVKDRIENEQRASAEYKDKLSMQKRMRDEKKEQLMELSSQHARHQNIFQNASSNKDNIKRRIKRVEKEIKDTAQQLSDLVDKEAAAKKQLEALNAHLDSITSRKSECEHELKAKNTQLSSKIKSLQEIENERSRYKSRLTVLKKMESNFEWYKDGVKAIMKNRQNDNDAGRIMSIAADIVDTAPGYEHAVEAAMGEALQYIIVNDQGAGIDYIHFLRDQNAGRSGFIPMDIRSAESFCNHCQNENKDKKQNTGCSDPRMLVDYVEARPGFESIVNTMLSKTAVVDDISDAVLLWERGNGLEKIVTLAGDVLSGSGFLVGGSREKMAGILEKKQEIKQIHRKLQAMDKTIAEEKKLQKEMESEVKTLENTLSDLTQKKFKYETEHLETEKSLYKKEQQLHHAKRQMEIIELEKTKLAGEKEDIDSEIAHHDQVLAEINDEIESIKSEIENITGAIEQLEESVRTYDDRMVDLKLEQTRLSAEMDNSRRTLYRLQASKREGTDRAGQVQKDIDAGIEKKEDINDKITSYKSLLAGEHALLKQISEDLKEEESDYRIIVDKQERTDHSIYEAKTGLEKAREKMHRLELELSGLQINRENIVNRYLERYSEPFSTVMPEFRETVNAPDFSIEKTEKEKIEIRTKIEEIGDVNPGAIETYEQQKSRYDFLFEQRRDLENALADLESVIRKINRVTRRLFVETFEAVNEKFMEMFPRLFNGGSARLELTHPDLPLETGVELMIQPPGKKLSRLSLLSGGEKALSAIAFIFSIFMLNPASFCLLDEIDAPLDDVNVYRFNELLRIIGEETQIIMISHKKKTMEFSDMLFGVTVTQSGDSRLIPVNIEKAMEMKKEEKPPIPTRH